MPLQNNYLSLRLYRPHVSHKARSQCFESAVIAESSTRVFFYLGFSLVIINRILDQTSANLNLEIIASLPFIPVALLFLLIRFVGVSLGIDVKHFFVSSILLILSIISYLKSGQSYLPTACLLLCGIGHINVRRLIKDTSTCILLLIVGLGLIQLMDWGLTGELVGSALRSNGRLRLSFYFSHPNTLGAIAFMSFVGLTACSEKLAASDCLLGLTVASLILLLTDSHTSCALLLIYIVVRGLFEMHPSLISREMRIVVLAIPLLFEILSILVMLQLIPEPVLLALNRLFNGRPGYWILQYNQLGGWTMFGQATLYGNQYINGWLYPSVTIDCFYAASLLQLGVWSFIIFYYLYFRSICRACDHNDVYKLVTLLVCALFGFTEVHMIDFSICFPMLLLGEYLFSHQPTSISADTNR